MCNDPAHFITDICGRNHEVIVDEGINIFFPFPGYKEATL